MAEADTRVVNVPGIGAVNFPATMTDAEVAAAIDKDIAPPPKSAGARARDVTQALYRKVVGDDPLRQLAIGSRSLAKGAMLPFNMALDLPMQIRNYAMGQQNPMPSQVLDPAANLAGAVGTTLPTPQGTTENVAAAANEGGGAALSLGLGGAQASGISPAALATMRSGVIGGSASEYLKQNNFPLWAQIAAGVVAPGAFDLAKLGLNVVGKTVLPPSMGGASPYTMGGRELAAGNVLARNTTAPAAAIERMAQDNVIVPGVTPRTAEVAQDTGLAKLDKLLQTTRPEYSATVQNAEGANNRVLRDTLANAVPDAEVAAGRAKAAAATAAREDLVLNARDVYGNDSQGLLKLIGDLKNSRDAFKDASVRPALDLVEKQLYDTKGNLITDPNRLDAVRQYVSSMIAGNFDQPAGLSYSRANASLKPVLEKVKGVIDNALREAPGLETPSYTETLKRTQQALVPVNQSEVLQELLKKASSKADIMPGGASAGGGENYRLVLSQLNSALSNERMASKAERVLTDGQLDTVSKVVQELERGAKLTSMQRNRLGSDTMQNLSSAALFGRVLGIDLKPEDVAKAPDYVQKVLGWVANLGGGPQEKILGIVEQAMHDPKLARELLRKAPASNLEGFGEAAARKGREYGAGAVIGNRAE